MSMTLFFFFFKQKTAYEIMPSLVGSEMCIRDRLTQLAVICFYICLASPDVLALDPKLAKVKRNLTLLGQFIFGVRVFRYENTHNPDTASRTHRFHQIIRRQVRYLMPFVVAALIAYAFASPI